MAARRAQRLLRAVATTAVAILCAAPPALAEATGPPGAGASVGFQPGPLSVAAGPSGDVYLSNPQGSGQIQRFSADGAPVARWGDFKWSAGNHARGRGIDVDAAGNVYVADAVNNRVQQFSAAGAFVGAWGSAGRGPGRFYTPTSVAADAAGNVYVADAGRPYLQAAGTARIQRFTASGQFLAQWGDVATLRRPGRPGLFAALGRTTARRSAIFHFRHRGREIRFQCRLSGRRVPRRLRRWRRCASPKRYAGLRPGSKLFRVRAVRGGRVGKPARRAWLIVRA